MSRTIRRIVQTGAMLAITLIASTARPAEHNARAAAIASITAGDLKAHVDRLADDTFEGREAGSRGGHAAGGYLVRFFEKYGLRAAGDEGTFFQSFGGGYRNILGLLEGSDPVLKHEIILIGAHYDHVGYGTRRTSYGPIGYIHNGADDNASGTAGLIETIEAFTLLGAAPRRSVLFALWDGEEKGLLGSKHWVSQPTVPLDQVRLMMNCDMIGRLRDNKIEVHGTRSSQGLRRLVSHSNQDTDLEIDFKWEVKQNSDHGPFFEQGTPIIMLHTGLHDDYHRPSDDAHLVNDEGMQRVARLLFNIAYSLSEADMVGEFRDEARNEFEGTKDRFEQPLEKAPPRLGVWWDVAESDRPGVGIARVLAGSAAEAGGLQVGDRVVRFAGRQVIDRHQLTRQILVAENPVEAIVMRPAAEERVTLLIELAGDSVRLGVAWREDDAEPGAVMLTRVIPGSPAYDAGLKVRDRVYSLGGQTIQDSLQFRELVTSHPGPLVLLVERSGKLRQVTVDVGSSAISDAAE